MDKKKSVTHHTEVHFHAPVGQYIDYIENQTVSFDKDMNMHIAHVQNSNASQPAAPTSLPPKFFCVSEKFPEQNIRDRLAAELSHSSTKMDYCRALYQLQHMGCIDINQYPSDEKRAEVFNKYQSTYKLSADDFYRARLTRNKRGKSA